MAKNNKINDIIKEIEEGKNKETEKKASIVKEYLIVDIDLNYFAIQLEYLREVIDLSDKNYIVPIPYTPQYILGIINIRDEIIPVLSLLKIFNIEDKNNNYTKIAIIDEKFKIAFPFFDIIDLKLVDINNIKLIKNATKKSKESFLIQEFEHNGKIISVIDILKLFSSEYLM